MKNANGKNEALLALASFTAAFTVMTLILAISGLLVTPADAEELENTLLGTEGLAYTTLLQIGAFSFLVGLGRLVFMSHVFIKKMLTLWRTALFLGCLTGAVALFSAVFGWFPTNSWEGWAGYFGGLAGSFAIMLLLSWLKTRRDSKKYNDLLREYKTKKKQ